MAEQGEQMAGAGWCLLPDGTVGGTEDHARTWSSWDQKKISICLRPCRESLCSAAQQWDDQVNEAGREGDGTKRGAAASRAGEH